MIHKTAVIDAKAKIFENVKVGPYCVIGPDVEIREGSNIHSHVNISGNTKIGKENKIYPFVSINDPQDLKYNDEQTNLTIGDNNKIHSNWKNGNDRWYDRCFARCNSIWVINWK